METLFVFIKDKWFDILFYFIGRIKINTDKLKKGLEIKYKRITIKIQVRKIEDSHPDKNIAYILSANTAFDDCTDDDESALGSFWKKYYNKFSDEEANKDINECLRVSNYQKDGSGQYPICSAILLPTKYDTPSKCIIVAFATKIILQGIKTHPDFIYKGIRNAFQITADKRIINTFFLPVVGSGHGGIDINEGLLILSHCFKFYAEHYHHIKNVVIFVHPDDLSKIEKRKIQKLLLL